MTLPDLLTTIFISALTAAFVTGAVIGLMALVNRHKWTPPPEQPPASWIAKQEGAQ